VVERWALSTIKKDIQRKRKTNLPRCCIEDASREICCDPQTKEELLDSTTDMYLCNTCHRTYHWQCLLDLGCYTDAQRDGIIANDDWAYPACSHLGHDEAFPPPSPDGNPFAHIYWLAEEKNETTHTTTKISLAPLQNIEDKVKAHMSKHHRLGDANTNSGY